MVKIKLWTDRLCSSALSAIPGLCFRFYGLVVVGFAGILVRACKVGHLTPEGVRDIMLKCASLGTHYANHFIEGVYQRLQEEIK